ncbi:very short patch repair endonuclease [Methylobacterium ajmalii]|jgi:DNA mismatch endonuclease (patch repair protein)|uniref:very short patch repair endonuclease n=1 Tax=Methylobacterium ajmalii TaxID=2738439 RepID=UPI00190BD09C|nr:very short patch repair endonuclease [Methylobacterium ajmalii]MBK3396322.1 DNA mismatch endonuclease Vsr [Methylobacterium ajmalii]MBK3412211.1 DNA mismatch endonuclease Vsr [Methylobacterium ajmalii]MBK3426355.1 DNA mismatch endonuclease Vsr [Methylobacterium ajmalii]MBZ6415189.1 very short patch repair endonuclease [Methylobacterium sp.]
MDRVDAEKRSAIMRSVRQSDTTPELALRSALHARGLRYRLHAKELRGRPDIVSRKYRTCIFVHGCFWHRHGCTKTTTPKSNVPFWTEKFEANVKRDRRAVVELLDAGWRVLTIWECGLSGKDKTAACADHVVDWLRGQEREGEYPPAPIPRSREEVMEERAPEGTVT